MPEPIRVGLFSELPTPYRWPIFERLLARPELDLRVFYCAKSERDRDWRFDFRPDSRVRFLPVRTLSLEGKRTIHYHVNPTVFRVLREQRFDVVVFPGYAMFASHAGETWCRWTGTPYVIFSETTPLDRRGAARRLLKRLAIRPLVAGASAWLATGKLSASYLTSYGARPEGVFPFPNTPDLAFFRDGAAAAAPGREALRARLGAADRPAVLFVGRLIGVKRCDVLIRAVARLRREGREAALWIAGDGADRPMLEALVRREGLDSGHFLGSVATAELPALYGAADVFVLPSDHEPWGAVVGEAMASGLPVVASDRVGAAPDLVTEANGTVFPAGDEAALAAGLGSLLSDRARLRRMGARSAERIRAYGPEACVGGFLAAVRFAAGRPGD